MAPIKEIVFDEGDEEEELRVTFYPELYLQRRIWILNILRRENITKVLDVGCGEGELLSALCQPAPWLTPPPSSILPPETPLSPLRSPTFNSADDIPNLHPTDVYGLDISQEDLAFAMERTKPPSPEPEIDPKSPQQRSFATSITRFEDLDVKIWKGGLEIINEEFLGVECIVSTEVIEHLTPFSFLFFPPMLLGVYHPNFLLVTTPSYTFNARFTSPTAPPSARKGFPDPTKRTDRIFRHSDHKFEWTREEFEVWCNDAARAWGYRVNWSSIGRALETDPFGRDAELGGASFVAEFKKLEGDILGDAMTDAERENRGRDTIQRLIASTDNNSDLLRHELVAHHRHIAHPLSRKPAPLAEIASAVKNKMEDYRETFMRLDELWFEKDISVPCGGWIEVMVRAVEQSAELELKKEEDGIRRNRDSWTVELVGRGTGSKNLWLEEGDQSIDYIPPDWTPGEALLDSTDHSDFGESTGAEGDISLNNSEDDDDENVNITADIVSMKGWPGKPRRRKTWAGPSTSPSAVEQDNSYGAWGSRTGAWGAGSWAESSDDDSGSKRPHNAAGSNSGPKKVKQSGNTSTAGWDGDEDESDDTTS